MMTEKQKVYSALEGQKVSENQRGDEFIERFEALQSGEFRPHSFTKIRRHLAQQCDFHMHLAGKFLKDDDAKFIYEVSLAEQYAQLLYHFTNPTGGEE